MPRTAAARARRRRYRRRRAAASNPRSSRTVTVPTRQPRQSVSRGPEVASSTSFKRVVRRPPRVVSSGVTKSDHMKARMESCSFDYAAALANPRTGPLACVPANFPFNTTRLRVEAKGTFKCGNGDSMGGMGFIFINPFHLVANNVDIGFYTGGAYTATVPSFSTSGTGVNTLTGSNSPYAASAFNASTPGGLLYRLVSVELRVSLISAGFYQSGFITPIVTPDHESLDGLAETAVAVAPGVQRHMVKYGEWYSCKWNGAIDQNEVDFQSNPSNFGSRCMGFAVTTSHGPPSGAGTAQGSDFAFEIYAVYELQGSKALNPIPGESDPMGFAHLKSAISKLGPQAMQRVSESGFWSAILEGVSSASLNVLHRSAALASSVALQSVLQRMTPSRRPPPMIMEL